MALLHLVAGWRERTPDAPDCLVLTLDHGLRPEARAETRMVERAAERHGLPCRVLHWEGEKPETGLQAAARAARQRLLGAPAENSGPKPWYLPITATIRPKPFSCACNGAAGSSAWRG